MRFDTKIGIAVRDDLLAWQRLNITAFLASAVAGGVPETIGQPYEDGSGNRYLAMFRQPVLVYAASGQELAEARAKGLSQGLDLAVYTEELFKTDNDEDNRASMLAVAADELQLVGLAVYGPRNAVDKVFKGLTMHP
jgi:hypothetical protein